MLLKENVHLCNEFAMNKSNTYLLTMREKRQTYRERERERDRQTGSQPDRDQQIARQTD